MRAECTRIKGVPSGHLVPLQAGLPLKFTLGLAAVGAYRQGREHHASRRPRSSRGAAANRRGRGRRLMHPLPHPERNGTRPPSPPPRPATPPSSPPHPAAGGVSRLDRVTLQLRVAVAVVIAICSYAVSAPSLYALGVEAGYSWWQAAAVPVVADGPAIYGMFRIVSRSRRSAKGAGYGWLLVGCGTAPSIRGEGAPTRKRAWG